MKRFIAGLIAAAVLISMAPIASGQQDRQVGDESRDGHR